MTARKLRIALALATTAAAAAAAPFSLGCGFACTDVGCNDSLTFAFDEQVPLDYVVTVEVAGRTGQADCTAATLEEGQDQKQLELTGDLSLSVSCTGTELVVLSAPTEAAITIVFPDGITTEARARPAYQELQPNGEGCEPTCRSATVDIDVHPPQGT
jgi:hypothetical protein